MGYTSYWYTQKELKQDRWDGMLADIKKVFATKEIQALGLQWERDEPKPPALNKAGVRFNGPGGAGHETFILEREGDGRVKPDDKLPCFSFCKTAQKPYDLAVCAVLIIAKRWHGDDIKVCSDGDDADWEAAGKLVLRELGYAGYPHFNGESDERELVV